MKPTTKEWLLAAEDDLLSARKLISEDRLTNIVAFHCQQCLEKAFKAVLEEQNRQSIKSHDLNRLREIAGISISESEITLLATINEVYIDARYPGDMGLMPHGKPTPSEAEKFIKLTESLLNRVREEIIG